MSYTDVVSPECSTAPSITSDFPKITARPNGATSVVSIGDVPFGGEVIPIIAGPCAVESQDLIERAAHMISDLGGAVLRGGAYKPRTSPYSFQGLGIEGLEMMRQAADEANIPLVTEVLSPEVVETMEPLVDAFQVGARNMQNFALLKALGQSTKPVLLKRSFGATLTEWILAAEYIADSGNDQIILCERGIRSFGDETRFTLDLAGALWARSKTRLPVIVDPSHAIGLPNLIGAATAAAVAAGLDGAMVEVHPDPTRALCDADQALHQDQFRELITRARPIAKAIGRPLYRH